MLFGRVEDDVPRHIGLESLVAHRYCVAARWKISDVKASAAVCVYRAHVGASFLAVNLKGSAGYDGAGGIRNRASEGACGLLTRDKNRKTHYQA